MPIFLSKVVHRPYLRIQLPKTFFTYCGQVLEQAKILVEKKELFLKGQLKSRIREKRRLFVKDRLFHSIVALSYFHLSPKKI